MDGNALLMKVYTQAGGGSVKPAGRIAAALLSGTVLAGVPMAAMAQDPPPYTFVAKNGRVAWDTVLNFNVQPFFDGSNVSPRDLEALDEVARRVEEARIEPEPNVPADEMAVVDFSLCEFVDHTVMEGLESYMEAFARKGGNLEVVGGVRSVDKATQSLSESSTVVRGAMVQLWGCYCPELLSTFQLQSDY